jgi:hypothetical protein
LLPLRALLLARLPWRAASCRLLVVSRAAGDAKLPASFVAPVTVNMDDYPPPRRRLSKGTAWRGVSLFADALHCGRRRSGAVRAQRRRWRAERE